MDLLELVGVGAVDRAWALGFLEPLDAARIVVALLENTTDARARVHWLRFGDAPFPPLDDHDLLGEAASHACWRALAILLDDLRTKSPTWTTLYDDNIADVDDLENDAAVARATRTHRGTHYRFGHDVVKAAGARGHLTAVRWLVPRSAESSGQVEPTRRDKHERRRGYCARRPRDLVAETVQAAAEARQLHVVEWLVNISPVLHCVLPYDEDIRGVCWTANDPGGYSTEYFCATKEHGYGRARCSYTGNLSSLKDADVIDTPLADGFARNGDLVTLKKIHARANYRQLIGRHAITAAAEHGHLEVVKWLYGLFPRSLTTTSVLGAAKGGHLDILRWVTTLDIRIHVMAIIEAAGCGHLHIVQWYESLDPSRWREYMGEALKAALKNSQLDMAKYLHEDCDARLEPLAIVEVLTTASSVEICDYVLERAGPAPLREHMPLFLMRASLEAIQHLALTRGLMGPSLFERVVHRQAPTASSRKTKLELARFLYNQAKARAERLGTTLNDQLTITHTSVLQQSDYALAEWLLTSVPEVKVTRSNTTVFNETFILQNSRRKVIVACIQHRPHECHSMSWLPMWAVRAHNFEALQLLEESGHPNLRDLETYGAITKYTRDARFMLKLLPLPDDSPELHHEVAEWAARFGMVKILDHVFDHAPRLIQSTYLKRVAYHVGNLGHVEMAHWFVERCISLEESTTAMLKGIQIDARRHGHTAVLQWLHTRQFLTETPRTIDAMVSEAAAACQIPTLQWLVSNLAVPPKLIVRVLMHAVRHNHVETAQYLVRMYRPSELPVSGQQRGQIREFVKTQRKPRGQAAVLDARADGIHNASRRSKRVRLR